MPIASNRVRDIERYYLSALANCYPAEEIRTFLWMLCEEWLGWNRAAYLLHRDEPINQSDLLRLYWAAQELMRHRPIQHIIGHVEFCGCRIRVSPDVLIPRPETEEMVQTLISALRSPLSVHHSPLPTPHSPLSTPRFLDLCTGSGCIAIALKKAFPWADGTAVDISPAALLIAQQNAAENATALHFVQADVLSYQRDGSYRLIVSNPPYVRQSERRQMRPNVLEHEPSLALFVPDDDPLRFYRAIGQYASQHLTPGGQLVVEINQALADETCALLQSLGFLPILHRDFRGQPRFLVASLAKSCA